MITKEYRIPRRRHPKHSNWRERVDSGLNPYLVEVLERENLEGSKRRWHITLHSGKKLFNVFLKQNEPPDFEQLCELVYKILKNKIPSFEFGNWSHQSNSKLVEKYNKRYPE